MKYRVRYSRVDKYYSVYDTEARRTLSRWPTQAVAEGVCERLNKALAIGACGFAAGRPAVGPDRRKAG